MTLTRSTALFFALLVCNFLQASTITQSPTRLFLSGLGPNDVVEWGTASDQGLGLPSGTIRTSSPAGIGVSITGSGLDIAVEGDGSIGNFALNDVVLFSNQALRLIFSAPIQGFGFQIQRLDLGSFTANLEAFGSGSVSFGSVSTNGSSTFGPSDDTAPFLGFYATVSDILSVVISVTPASVGGSTDFAINRATILSSLDPVPEPQTLPLIGCGLSLLAIMRRRK